MNEEFSNCDRPSDKIINSEEWEPIIKAIVVGKYSWACVLILYVIGLNPIEYIPYRTYMRLIKNNCMFARNSKNETDDMKLQLYTIKSKWTRLSNSQLK